MQRKPSARIATLAVTQTKLAVESKLDWLFREQPTEDYGIDAQAEVVDDAQDVRGRLLALQIKGGLSWFERPGPGGWWFYPDTAHVQYWTNHSLPVIVVLYHPDTQCCHWEIVSPQTLVETAGKNWKMLIPEAHVLDEGARDLLREAAEGNPYELRIRELQLAKPWMQMLASGQRLVVDMEEWINKSSKRGSISVGIDTEDGKEPTPLASWGIMVGPSSYAGIVPRMFAWADASIHGETYDDAEYDAYEAECVYVDREGDRIATDDFTEWRQPLVDIGLRPYRNDSGEVDFWRLELTLYPGRSA